MNTQASFAARFSEALRAPTFGCPPGLKAWNGSDPAKRFAVYRNNVLVGLIDALAETYPVVQALVGEEFFRAMAAEFVRASPPSSPVLAWYGAGFADFIAAFPPVAGLPYLADVARLEWLRVEAWHAADAEPLDRDTLSVLLADAEALPLTRFVLQPSLRVLRSPHPVVSLWAAHQVDDPAAALAKIDLARGEAAFLARPGLEVEITPIEPGAAGFIARLLAGETLGAAAAAEESFDLAASLALLIRSGALIACERSGL
ncbi:HvfC/BufC N-terminal domain-containing protein [Sulfuricystis multivorans]|uniref:HvfC/BufC N-terminal domain-containing protein n=1 Tax=Sulfuricystis multivorans TaxID=2211108 RepID=UPI000F8490CC|nr:DNA-binding domain-containing protein [Sulfuricystis multivorans]